MKRFLALLASTLLCTTASAVTQVPVQMLNPTGSTSGQAIVSTGASSAPTWGAVASAGANSNITSLTGLTTPLGTWAGGLGANNSTANGVPVFSSGAATVTATTGTGAPVLGTSPTLATPVISGVVSGACAAAGKVGECVSSNVAQGSAVALTNNVAKDVTSVSLSAGNWLCYGNVGFNPAGTTVTSQELGWISTTSATIPTPTNFGAEIGLTTLGATGGGNADILPVGMLMLNATTTTPVYLDVYASFTTSTSAAYGYINCIRIH